MAKDFPRARDLKYGKPWTTPDGRFTISYFGERGGGAAWGVHDRVESRSYRCRSFGDVKETIRDARLSHEKGGA